MNPNDIIPYILNYLAHADKTAVIVSLFTLFIILYFIIIWFSDISKSSAIILAYILILLIDLTISFGTYVFTFPLGYTYTVTKGTLTLGLVDWILNFGIWKEEGLSIFNQVTGQYVLSGFQLILTYIFAFGDSIFEFLLLAYIFYSLFGKLDYALMVAAIPVILYTNATNPLKELDTVQATTEHLFYFFNNATQEQLLTVLLTFVLSFAIIVFLLSTLTNLLTGIGKSTVMPGLESKTWEFSFTGMAFGLALVYSIAVLLHPEFSWYVVLPALVLYSIIRKSLKGHSDSRREKREQRELITEAVNESRYQQR